MRQLLQLAVIIIVLLFCYSFAKYLTRDRVEQQFFRGNYVTYVWVDGDIAISWYDDPGSITADIICKRKIQAEEYLKNWSGNKNKCEK